ncbi:peptide deformylase [Paenibacillus sp. MMS20-IR301]|uniref:peptide deformylase n=1 Tax=Paenibacillus sp. MMS20-IR301 TaxID=2895946 RepID=UPI0028EF1F30|nr:peptide deformylase [Paenibacillus sp. MMS20-IR301]WNS46565.1 peptide deformylase [Paenibacillus sp. MMS20-IR301]
MIRPICKDTMLLSQRSAPATKDDIPVLDDLLETLRANSDRCVGMAADMIGVNKRIIAFSIGPANIAMINPVITGRDTPYEAEEGCLSLEGVRRTVRYQTIEVEFLDRNFKQHKQSFTGFTAQIIQHEIDHCDGIVI